MKISAILIIALLVQSCAAFCIIGDCEAEETNQTIINVVALVVVGLMFICMLYAFYRCCTCCCRRKENKQYGYKILYEDKKTMVNP